MLNSKMVKFGFITAIFVFTSCHNDVPDLPLPSEVAEYQFCRYTDKNGPQCKSTYEISVKNCTAVGGELDYTPCPPTTP